MICLPYHVDLAETGADPSKPAKRAKVATVGLALSAISTAHAPPDLSLRPRPGATLPSKIPPAAIGGRSRSMFDFTRFDDGGIAEQAAVDNNTRRQRPYQRRPQKGSEE
jgi:hypothetical protein